MAAPQPTCPLHWLMRIQALAILLLRARPSLWVLQQINSKTSMMALSNASSVSDIKSLVQKGDVEGGIVIPSNFTASILSGEQGTLIIVTDQSNPQVSADHSGSFVSCI